MDRRVNVNPSPPYCMVQRDCVEEFRRSLWGGTLKEGFSQEVQLRKKMWIRIQENFRMTKSLEENLVEAGVTDTLGQT